MPQHPKTVELDSFNGLNNVLPPERTDPKYLKEAMNIDIDKSGGIRKRKGYTKKISGDFHSIWSTDDNSRCFAVKDDILIEIYSDYTQSYVGSILEDSFEHWTDPTVPNSWAKGGTHTPGSNYVEESPADSLHMVSDGTFLSLLQTNILTIGTTYNYEIICSAAAANGIEFFTSSSFLTVNSATTYSGTFIADSTSIGMKRSGATDITLSSIRIWTTSTIPDKVSFEEIDGNIYYISDTQTGVIEGTSVRSFGLGRPKHNPTLTSGTGSLESGVYQVATTYITVDGKESGANLASQIDVALNTGIVLSNIAVSVDSDITHVRIYCSTPNGETLYLQDEITNGTASYTITGVREGITPLKSFNVFKAPAGHIIRQAHGRLWIAQDNILHYSEPFAYDWWKYHSNFFEFPERIRAIMPTEGGMWVASDKLYYLTGKSPERMSRLEREPIKVVEGSDVKIPGAYIFIENTPIGFKWLFTSDKGMFVAFNDGIVLNLTEKNVALPEAIDGTGLFIQEGGINRYLSILKEKRSSNNTAVGDLVTTTVIRNGVVIT